MANSNPPKRAQAFTFYVGLQDIAVNGSVMVDPAIEAGDFKISKDGGAFANLATLPAITPAGGAALKIALSGTETTCDQFVILGKDQSSPRLWADVIVCILTTA